VTRAALIDYDLGNLPSVTKAVERVGVKVDIVDRGEQLTESFDAVILPCVGHFGTGARNLAERDFDEPLKRWAASGAPLLGICVGLQLFCDTSDEDLDARGLGIVPGHVKRLEAPKVPHMGWNTLDVRADSRVLSALEPGDMAYFEDSYYVCPDDSAVAATTTYNETFCSAVEMDNVVGFQFHPEKSANVGRKLLERFFDDL